MWFGFVQMQEGCCKAREPALFQEPEANFRLSYASPFHLSWRFLLDRKQYSETRLVRWRNRERGWLAKVLSSQMGRRSHFRIDTVPVLAFNRASGTYRLTHYCALVSSFKS